MLMRLVISGPASGVIGHPLVASEAMLKQTQVPAFRIAAVADSSTQEEILRVEIVTLGLIRGDPVSDLSGQLGHDHFIGIDDQHPVVPERDIFESPVFLLGVTSAELKLDDGGPEPGCNMGGFVAALAVDDEDLVRPRECRKAAPEVLGLVLDGYDHTDRCFESTAARAHRSDYGRLLEQLIGKGHVHRLHEEFVVSPGWSHRST